MLLTQDLYEQVIEQVTEVLLQPTDRMALIVVSDDQTNGIETLKLHYLEKPWYPGGGSSSRPSMVKVTPFTAIKISVNLSTVLTKFESIISVKYETSQPKYRQQLLKNVVTKLFKSISQIVKVEGSVAVIFYQDIFILLLLFEYLFRV